MQKEITKTKAKRIEIEKENHNLKQKNLKFIENSEKTKEN